MLPNLVRAAFALLIGFEGLNVLGWLDISLVYSWFGLMITAAAVWILMEITHRLRPHHPASWSIALFALLLDAGGDIFKLYAWTPTFATSLHFTTSSLIALIGLLWIYHNAKKLTGWDYWHTWTAVVALGAMYDVEEYWESVFLHNNRYLGAAEMTDITADCFGALTMMLIVWLVLRARRSQTMAHAPRVAEDFNA